MAEVSHPFRRATDKAVADNVIDHSLNFTASTCSRNSHGPACHANIEAII